MNEKVLTMRGILSAICISERKGERKTPVMSASLVTNSGLAGDAQRYGL